MHTAKNSKSSLSKRPNFSLQSLQLGAVHRWTLLGVVSGYQEPGKTWSFVASVRVVPQWIHLPSLRGRLIVVWFMFNKPGAPSFFGLGVGDAHHRKARINQ